MMHSQVRSHNRRLAAFRCDGERIDDGASATSEVSDLARAAIALLAIGAPTTDAPLTVEMRYGRTRLCAASFDVGIAILDVSGSGRLSRSFLEEARQFSETLGNLSDHERSRAWR